jgi:hypothetical protein
MFTCFEHEPGRREAGLADQIPRNHLRKGVMKKFLWTCVLALPLAAASQQTASAFEIHWSGSCNWNWSWGCSWHCHNCCTDCGMPDGFYGASYGGDYAGACLDGSSTAAYGGYSSMPVQAMAQPLVNYASYGFQPVGYTNIPSYWYGR